MEQPGLGRAGQERCSTVRAELLRDVRNRHGIDFLAGLEPGSVGLQLCLCSGDRSEPVSSATCELTGQASVHQSTPALCTGVLVGAPYTCAPQVPQKVGMLWAGLCVIQV